MNQESRKTGRDLRNQEITERIIAAAIRVHRELGLGFLESIYEQALAVEFALGGIQFVRQKPIALFYKDHQIGEHRRRWFASQFRHVTALDQTVLPRAPAGQRYS